MKDALRMEELPLDERPLEKLRNMGAEALSDAELIAVLLRCGSPGENALSLAQRILRGITEVPSANSSEETALNPFAKKTALGSISGRELLKTVDMTELCKIRGVGPVKAAQIVSALELGKRVHCSLQTQKIKLNTPELVWKFYRCKMGSSGQESMRLIMLDVKNRLIREEEVCRGGLSSLVIQPREIMRLAVRANAASIILTHNHPSGDSIPSQEDIESSRKLLKVGKLMGISLIDHVIICEHSFCSLRRDSDIWAKDE